MAKRHKDYLSRAFIAKAVGCCVIGLLASFSSGSFAAATGGTIAVQRLIEVVDLAGPVISPDGTKVAFRTEQASVVRNVYDTIWYVQDTSGRHPPVKVGDGGVPLRNSAGVTSPPTAIWSADGSGFYYLALIDDELQVWRAEADGSGARPMTMDPANVRRFALSADGSRLYYSVGATRDEVASAEMTEYHRGIHVDESVPLGHGGLFRSGFVEGRLATQRIQFWYDRIPLLSDVPEQWKRVDLRTGEVQLLDPSEKPPLPVPPDLPTDVAAWKVANDLIGNRTALLVRTGAQGDLIQKPVVEMLTKSGNSSSSLKKCENTLCADKPIWTIAWRPGSDELLFTLSDDGWAESIYAWNVRTDRVREIVRSSGLIKDGERYGRSDKGCGISPSTLVCVTAAADQPPRLESIDLTSGRRSILFDPNMSLAEDVTNNLITRTIRWRDKRGKKFTGTFIKSSQYIANPTPLFVTYYRCPGFLPGAYGGDWPLHAMASHGISTLCINSAPLPYDAVNRYNDGRFAVESAIDMLASSGEVDRTKVGMGGLSFGTEITMWTAWNSDILAATSIASTMFSRAMYNDGSIQGDKFFDNLEGIWQLGDPEVNTKSWEKIAFEYNYKNIKSPILMQITEQEYIWMLDPAVKLVRDHKADFYVFPNAPHFKSQPK